jgi:hypothetical protein
MNQWKQVQYAALVADRKACHACSGLANPSTYAQGRYDSAEIGLWTRWQGNLDAKGMVVGQDWGDIVYFDRYNGLNAPSNPTNRALSGLLNSIGIKIDQHSLAAGHGQIFLTNAILCLKTGGMTCITRYCCFAVVLQLWFALAPDSNRGLSGQKSLSALVVMPIGLSFLPMG